MNQMLVALDVVELELIPTLFIFVFMLKLLVGVRTSALSLTFRVGEPAEGAVNMRSRIHASGWGVMSIAIWAFTFSNVLKFALMALKSLSVKDSDELSVRLSSTSFVFQQLVVAPFTAFALGVIERLNHIRLSHFLLS